MASQPVAAKPYGGDMAVAAVYGPSGMGKCLSGTTQIVLSDGRVKSAQQLVDEGDLVEVLALGDNYQIAPAKVSAFYRNGKKEVIRVKTASGRQIDVTKNHPLLGAGGWAAAELFRPRDLIAVPRVLRVFGTKDVPAHEVDFLALFLADGAFDDSAVTYTNSYPEKIEAMQKAVAEFSGVEMMRVTLHGEETITYRIRGIARDRQAHAVHTFLRDNGLENCRAATKRVPSWVFELGRAQLARFLSLYLGSDGGCEKQSGSYSFSSASEKMLRQVSHLLLRFGVMGRIRTKVVKGVPYWEWKAATAEGTEILRREIAPIGKDIPAKTAIRANTWDVLPLSNKDVDSRRSWPDSPISRYSAQRLKNPSKKVLDLAFSDVYWDRVESIEDLGLMETFDLTVPGPANFVGNDVFAHNTTDLIYSFPRGLFFARPGALKPSFNVVGYTPANVPVTTIEAAIAQVQAEAKARRFDTLVVDDFSLMVQDSFNAIEAANPNTKNGFALWGELNRKICALRDTARSCGMHVIFSCHESAPTTKDGRFIRGGPKLPGKMPEDFPGVVDTVLRTALDKGRPGWHGVYKCSIDDPNYVTKDRHGVVPETAPMNLGEILRLAGYEILRAPGLEWQEEVVAAIAEELLELKVDAGYTKKAGEVAKKATEVMKTVTDDLLHIRWALRDGFDRSALIRARQSILSTFGV